MNGRTAWSLGLCILGIALPASASLPAAASLRDGGGRDVSIALFSTRTLHAVTLTAMSPDAWTAHCAQCQRRALTQPMHVAWPMEVFAGGTLRVVDDASGDTRAASGLWHLRGSGQDHAVDVVLTMPSERYVAAVLHGETAPGETAQALRAMAIVARTYALNGSHYAARPGHLTAELCDSTACQAMLTGPAGAVIDDAVQATAGETLWFGERRAEVFFSQSCGGTTEDAGAAWPALRGVPYLKSHADPYCLRRGPSGWHAEVPLAAFAEIVKSEGWRLPANPVAARVMERSGSQRALQVGFTGVDGARAEVAASALRFGIGRALGWDKVRSDAYEVGVRNDALVFDGRGHGHGVGLCQEGAAEMAAEGKDARTILQFYFPGTAVRILAGDEGWQEQRAGAITLRTTHTLTSLREAALEQMWSEAQQRFPPRRAIAPEVVFAASTEVFRQMTTQPGWVLASTRGDRIVLQPEAILKARGRDERVTLLHEMLHVLIEAEASDRAPLWLREGLVQVLARDRTDGAKPVQGNALPVGAIECALVRAGSLSESERAHVAAEERVRGLTMRYGISAVRGWLSSGVPAGVE